MHWKFRPAAVRSLSRTLPLHRVRLRGAGVLRFIAKRRFRVYSLEERASAEMSVASVIFSKVVENKRNAG